MGVAVSFNYYFLFNKAEETESDEDDLFFKVLDESSTFEKNAFFFGGTSLIEWETDIVGYSKLGSGIYFSVFQKIQEAASKPTCFKKALEEIKNSTLQMLEYDDYKYSKEKVLTELNKIEMNIKFTDEEKKKLDKAKKYIALKPGENFNR
jgi:hypothetical protein